MSWDAPLARVPNPEFKLSAPSCNVPIPLNSSFVPAPSFVPISPTPLWSNDIPLCKLPSEARAPLSPAVAALTVAPCVLLKVPYNVAAPPPISPLADNCLLSASAPLAIPFNAVTYGFSTSTSA